MDYIKTDEDLRRLLRAATDEDPGDGTVIRAVLKYVARTRNMSALSRDTELNRGRSIQGAVRRRQPDPVDAAEDHQGAGAPAAHRAHPGIATQRRDCIPPALYTSDAIGLLCWAGLDSFDRPWAWE